MNIGPPNYRSSGAPVCKHQYMNMVYDVVLSHFNTEGQSFVHEQNSKLNTNKLIMQLQPNESKVNHLTT